MTSEYDQLIFWSQQAVESQHKMLETVRGSASKWQTAIAAFLGSFVTVSFVWGPEKLKDFPLAGVAKFACISVLFVGGVLAIVAVYYANFASQGFPKVTEDQPITGVELQQQTQAAARKASGHLSTAMVLAGLAGLCIVGATGWVLAAAASKAPSEDIYATLLVADTAYCGKLVATGGVLTLELPGGAGSVPVGGGELEIIAKCP